MPRLISFSRSSGMRTAARADGYSKTYLSYVLLIVFLINVMDIADRTVMGVIIPPIKSEFGFSDLQLGILSGLAFTIVYSVLGIPLGRLSDRRSRRNMITFCVGLWSVSTAAFGMAGSYVQMLLSRGGVAFGEAGFTPAVHSILSDYFPPSRRATALSVFGLGATMGVLIGNAVGGYLAAHFGWRVVFIAFGVPGMVLALLTIATLREPQRGNTEAGEENAAELPKATSAISFALRTRSIRFLMLATGAHLLVFYGMAVWLPPFWVRSHGLTLQQAGLAVGLATGVFGGAGTLIGGYVSDRLSRRNMGWYAWLNALCILAMIPFGIGMYLWPSTYGAVVFGCFVAFLGAVWLAPTFAVVQHVSPLRMRGVVAAVLIATQNMIGLGLGPVLIGWLSDTLSPDLGTESLRWAMFIVFFIELAAVVLYFLAGRWVAHDISKHRHSAMGYT